MRIRSSLLATLLALLAIPAVASAQYDPRYPRGPGGQPSGPRQSGPGPTGLTLGARLGYGFPAGSISHEGDPRLGSLIDYKIPIWLELGYRFNPTIWGGVFMELAPGSVAGTYCLNGGSCDAFDWRFGIDLQLHLQPYQRVDPWVGIGFGVESLRADTGVDTNGDGIADANGTVHYTGWEFPLLEGGVDLAVTPHFTVGPFLSWSLGTYTSASVDAPGLASGDFDIRDRAVHSWVEVGVKGTFKL